MASRLHRLKIILKKNRQNFIKKKTKKYVYKAKEYKSDKRFEST